MVRHLTPMSNEATLNLWRRVRESASETVKDLACLRQERGLPSQQVWHDECFIPTRMGYTFGANVENVGLAHVAMSRMSIIHHESAKYNSSLTCVYGSQVWSSACGNLRVAVIHEMTEVVDTNSTVVKLLEH